MNLRRKSRCKLKIFGSFSGTKSRLFKSETNLSSGSDPILLGIKHHNEDQEVRHLNRVINRHTSVLTSSEQKMVAPPVRSYSMCFSNQTQKHYEPTPGSLHSLPHYSTMSHPRGHHVSSYFRLAEHAEESEAGNVSRRSPSFNDSVMSDSNYDSGAFSRNSSPTCHRSRVSTPEPVATPEVFSTPRADKFHRDVSPLVSPPLVLSVTRQSRVRTCHVTRPETVSSNRGQMSASPVTVTIGASTRLCINDNDKYQSLPNLAILKRSDTRLGLGGNHPASTAGTVKMTKMPHMGTSRLTTPPKPPRVRSVMMMSNSHSSLERPRISTSTAALLTRSNTSVGVYKDQDRSPSFPRSVRDGSCGSDTSSGVFSVASTTSATSDHAVPPHGQHYRVTVNGQHLDTL